MKDIRAKAVPVSSIAASPAWPKALEEALDVLGGLAPEDLEARSVSLRPLREMSLRGGLSGVPVSHRQVGAKSSTTRGILGPDGLTIRDLGGTAGPALASDVAEAAS